MVDSTSRMYYHCIKKDHYVGVYLACADIRGASPSDMMIMHVFMNTILTFILCLYSVICFSYYLGIRQQ